MSEIKSENIKPESSVVNPTQLSKAITSNNNKPAKVALSKARTSKNNKPAKVALSKARTSKNNKPTQAIHSSDELKNEVRFRKSKRYQNQLNGLSLKCLTYSHR